jgi:hypothetical protein
MQVRWQWIPVLVLAAACRGRERETGNLDARPGAEVPVDDRRLENRTGEVEYEAPRLIPALRNQIALLRGGRQSEGNLESYRGTVAHLVDAMEADLNRAAMPDSGRFRLMADSVLRALGGGAGDPGPDPDAARRSVGAVERLVQEYERLMARARTGRADSAP